MNTPEGLEAERTVVGGVVFLVVSWAAWILLCAAFGQLSHGRSLPHLIFYQHHIWPIRFAEILALVMLCGAASGFLIYGVLGMPQSSSSLVSFRRRRPLRTGRGKQDAG